MVATSYFSYSRRIPGSRLALELYRFRVLRRTLRRFLAQAEGGMMFSGTLRAAFLRFHQIRIGSMTYGPGLVPGKVPPGTSFGHFTSVGGGLEILRRNHTLSRFSQHPLFYNHVLGFLSQDNVPGKLDNPLQVGSDVWLGLNVIVCPGCQIIGDGTIIGAGSVVTKNLPPFVVAAGVPAKILRNRFDEPFLSTIANSRWWDFSPDHILRHAHLFTTELTHELLTEFSKAFAQP